MSKKDAEILTMRNLVEKRKELDRELDKLKIPCSHTKESNGRLKVEFINERYVRCEKCGCEFDFTRIETDELKNAVNIIHNAINQIKVMSDAPEREKKVLRELGTMDYNLSELLDLYKRTINTFGKGKKKKKSKDSSFGSYGAASIDFINGRRNKY